MTTPTLHQAAQVALDALEPLSAYGRVGTRDVDQAALQQVCAALREALAQPQAEPVDQQIESINAVFDAWRNGEDASMTLALSAPPADGDRVEAAIDDYIDGYVMEGDDGYYQPNDGDTAMLKDAMMGLLVDPGFLAAYDGTPPAAPPAAPADDHATPSGGQEAGPQEDRIEAAYWRFDARHKGYSQWKTAPMSERDAFKAEMRNALEAEKVRAEMRLVARGWRRPDAPAAPAPAAPVPDGWVMVPMEPTPEMIAAMPYPANTIPAVGVACYRAMITASPAAPAAPVVPLTDSELAKIAVEDEFLLYCGQDSFNEIARAIEAAHGIIGGKP